MDTKEHPGKFDCYEKALPNEPRFTLLARDPDFARLVRKWTKRRVADIQAGERPDSDYGLIGEAEALATNGARWRREHMGEWRK